MMVTCSGARLATMLAMGQSRPWPEALEALTGSGGWTRRRCSITSRRCAHGWRRRTKGRAAGGDVDPAIVVIAAIANAGMPRGAPMAGGEIDQCVASSVSDPPAARKPRAQWEAEQNSYFPGATLGISPAPSTIRAPCARAQVKRSGYGVSISL